MKNIFLTNQANLDDTTQKYNYLQKNFKRNTVDINRLLNRVKINEKNKKKENLVYLSIAILTISIISLFLFI